MLCLRVVGIGTEVEFYQQKNKEAAGNAQGQSKHIDERMALVPDDVSVRNNQVISQHGFRMVND
jgi:hypothetical protein